MRYKIDKLAMLAGWAVLLWQFAGTAQAIPSFARQTGMPCSACHTVFPQLTAFGRDFKLNGYTLSSGERRLPPLAAGVQLTYTRLGEAGQELDGKKPRVPQSASLYYGGRITEKLGAFAQLAYEDEEDFALEMADIRYADQTTFGRRNLLYGLTLNNMPTLQDVWNSTPVYMFPYEPTAIAPEPAAGLGLSMPLSMRVVGLGVYTLWDNAVYVELTGYRSRDGGEMGELMDVAPYWRLAYTGQRESASYAAGAYGISGKTRLDAADPMAMMLGMMQEYRDVALDAQYQYVDDPHIVTAYATWIRRRTEYGDSMTGAAARDLDILRLNAGYVYQRMYGVTLGYFAVRGDADPALYPPGEVEGSASGRPDTRGAVLEFDYLPQLQTKLALQYTAYDEFNGASTNYDGFGRDARDNNTLYLLANFMF
ncbi:MAG: hypothetical protein A2V90_04825 [Gammaproteobacteria bacterium RBG_16_57_12]|nr:MAG: hypothetical protein A2V90_04825 [Gammaproteobacteria bacterium RBG_16_57_12]